MAVKCTNCGGAHPSWDCSKPKNIGLMQSVSKDTLKVVPSLAKGDNQRDEAGATPALLQVATDTPHKPKMGRPRTGYIKAEYNRKYSADQRMLKRLGVSMTVKEYRMNLALAEEINRQKTSSL